MKKREKVVIILCVILFFFIIGLLRYTYNVSKERDDFYGAIQAKDDTIFTWRSKAGLEHASRIAAEVSLSQAKVLFKRDLDSVAKESGINKNKIKNFTKIIAQVKADYTALLESYGNGDTVYVFVDSSTYRKSTGYIVKNKDKSKNPKIIVSNSITVPINATLYNDKSWFWGKDKPRIEAYSPNKEVKITGLQSVTVKDRNKNRFGNIASFAAGAATMFIIGILSK